MVKSRKLFVLTLWSQGSYMLLTALWALIDIKSFVQVTGPKTDIWLVKTVSVLLIPISVCFFLNAMVRTHPLPVILMGISASFGLSFIDFYYTANDTIKWVYTLDGILELVFGIIWTYFLSVYKRLLKEGNLT